MEKPECLANCAIVINVVILVAKAYAVELNERVLIKDPGVVVVLSAKMQCPWHSRLSWATAGHWGQPGTRS